MLAAKSFADIAVSGTGVGAEEFLEASDGLVEMFELLGHGVFTFIQADIRGNIAGLRSRLAAHRDPTLEAVLASPDAHAIGCVVRLIRGFRYICRALSMMRQNPELELHTCFKRAYDEILKQHHSFVIRSLVAVAIRAAPSRRDFYHRMAQGEDVDLLDQEMARWLAGLDRIVTHMSRLLPYQ